MIAKQTADNNMHVIKHQSIYVLDSAFKDITSRASHRVNNSLLRVVLSLEGIDI